jgi:hypothetical protein
MSILSIYSGGGEATKPRKDLKTVEGENVEQTKDIKGAILAVSIGTAGGSTVGLLFSHVLRGTLYGLIGSTVYVVAKKGKEVDLPAQTGMTVRMDTSLELPAALMRNAALTTSGGN